MPNSTANPAAIYVKEAAGYPDGENSKSTTAKSSARSRSAWTVRGGTKTTSSWSGCGAR